jgi:hypothetical protein
MLARAEYSAHPRTRRRLSDHSPATPPAYRGRRRRHRVRVARSSASAAPLGCDRTESLSPVVPGIPSATRAAVTRSSARRRFR